MKEYDEKEWILKHLRICGYQIEEISFLTFEEIAKQHENLYSIKLRFGEELVDRIVFQHGQCLDMLSKNIQVIDMLGKNNDVIFPKNNDGTKIELSERYPIIMGENKYPDNIAADTVLFYENFVSLREHFFKGNRFIQMVCWVRTDIKNCFLNWGKYGFYRPTIYTPLKI